MKLLFVLVPISFVIGLALGFYFYIYLFFPLELGTLTNTIPVTSIFAMAGVIVKLVREWQKKLFPRFGEIFKENNVYFLQVIKVRGEESAEDCEGYITTKDIDNYVSVWRFANLRVRTIMNREDLRLFELRDGEIIFPAANPDRYVEITNNPFGKKEVKLSDYINEKTNCNNW
jgi:hypothetical protein